MPIHSHDALYVCDESMTIVEWNAAAEELTGIPAAEALGQKCWRVLHGRSETGEIVCHPGCSTARLARTSYPTGCGCLLVRTATGRKPLHISTILVQDAGGLKVLHPMHNGVEVDDRRPADETPPLTPRQLEVLEMLAHGMRAREIAAELHLAEATVRNHIRGVRRELGTHSQLEAVAAARRAGILS
ncbi:MAG TPA: LuxR C-terminal-related transcriptional regulator [Gaiellaceae bacterium]|nr:LuxR C-terminal-related transcriptional regulator [Gaiellaceae bacterium]